MANNPFDSQKYQNFLNWFKDCKSNPYNQNTYLFGEGLSYYEQLSLIGSFLYDLKEYITTSDWTTGEELQAIIDQIEAEKQNVLISGENIKTINSESILSAGNLDLQEKLIAGQNIVISPDGKTISASGTVGIDYPNVSNKPQINGHTLQSGDNTLDTLGIQAKDDTILFQNDVIDNLISEDTTLPLSAKQGKILDETKQDILVSGSDIKTLAEIPLLGEGNIPLKTLNGQSLIGSENIPFKTVGSESIFGTGNIAFKTINSNSLMGEGNMTLMDLVENAVNNDILLTDSNGQAIDSRRQLSSLANASDIGNLSNLNTTNKNNLVSAINETLNKTTSININDSITIKEGLNVLKKEGRKQNNVVFLNITVSGTLNAATENTIATIDNAIRPTPETIYCNAIEFDINFLNVESIMCFIGPYGDIVVKPNNNVDNKPYYNICLTYVI